MDVHVLVYDLSRGLARQMSMGMLGFQLDAVYHTSIKLNGLEYVYDGDIVSIIPGSSHLGHPEQEIYLGKTELPLDVVEEYIDSIREIYTVEAYNLWRHNCNNFSNDLSMFLLGKGIPDHIVNMPQAVLDSPMGQMLLPALEQQINANRQTGGILGIQGNATRSTSNPQPQVRPESTVKEVSNLRELNSLLEAAKNSSAVIFFTSATCGPCKMVDPIYDQLAAEVGNKCTLIKVDISRAFDVSTKCSVSATPTFITFLRGHQENRWSGADPAALQGNIRLLVQMAFPHHPHESLRLPTIANPDAKPVIFTKTPPFDKLVAKMGSAGASPAVKELRAFLDARTRDVPAEARLPDMPKIAHFVQESMGSLPVELLFTAVDLLRCGFIDPRFSGYFAEEGDHKTVLTVLNRVNALSECPYALRLVTLQMTCNLFSSPLYQDEILGNAALRAPIIQLVSASFLDDSHSNVRVAAASLLFNVALANSTRRRAGTGDALSDGDQVELAASVLEAISQEESSSEALEGMLLALGYLIYRTPLDGELADLLRAMDAEDTILGKKKQFPNLSIVTEIGQELLGKGLRKP